MNKYRQEPRYNVADSVEVYVGDNKYFVFLDCEVVVRDVIGKNGKTILRRVSSKSIETRAILKASDKVNSKE